MRKTKPFNVLVYQCGDLHTSQPDVHTEELCVDFWDTSAPRFEGYNAVILPYDSFVIGVDDDESTVAIDTTERDRRNKQIDLLLRRGGVVCWLLDWIPMVAQVRRTASPEAYASSHYDRILGAYPGFADLSAAGYGHLWPLGVPSPDVRCVEPRLAAWVERYSSARHVLHSVEPGDQAAPPICRAGDRSIVGVRTRRHTGEVYFLPYAANCIEEAEQGSALVGLARCLSVRLESGQERAPAWLDEFRFGDERHLAEELEVVQVRVAELDGLIGPYSAYKRLLYSGGGNLVDAVHESLEAFGFCVEREERYAEDLFICSSAGERRLVCEVKGLVANVKGEHVSQLEMHRSENDLDHDFPGIVLANTFRKAASLAEKDREVEPKVRKHAASRNMVVLRTLDLLRLLDQIDTGGLSADRVTRIWTESRGWMHVKPNGSYEVLAE